MWFAPGGAPCSPVAPALFGEIRPNLDVVAASSRGHRWAPAEAECSPHCQEWCQGPIPPTGPPHTSPTQGWGCAPARRFQRISAISPVSPHGPRNYTKTRSKCKPMLKSDSMDLEHTPEHQETMGSPYQESSKGCTSISAPFRQITGGKL